MALEFKQKGAGVGSELRVSIRLQYQLVKGLGIEKVGIHLSGAWPIAGMFGIGGNYVELVFTRAVGSYGHIIHVLPNE